MLDSRVILASSSRNSPTTSTPPGANFILTSWRVSTGSGSC
jgi:hypothetical protein